MPVDDRLHGFAARYVASPQWVKTLAGGAYSLVPPAMRHGPAYGRFKRLFIADPPDPVYIADRMRETLRAALTGVPAFAAHKHLLDGLHTTPFDVLHQLPLTAKEDIKRGLDDYLNHRHDASSRLRMFTGGSTAIPMTFYVHRGISRAKEWAAFHAMGDRFGTEGQGVVLALRGRTVSTAGSGRVWMYEPIKRHLILSSDHLEPKYMPEYVNALRRWRPRHIHAFPSALFPLIVWLREHNQQALLSQVSSVVLTSESVFEHHMRAFQTFFDCPVLATYGHTERVLLANTLPDDPRYHFWPHYGHLELIDNDGHAVTQPGEVGEIVGTSFDNLVMPFVRYRTGDYAVLGSQPNPIAQGFPVLERIDGRLQEFVVCRDHRLVTVTTLGAAHFEQLDQCLRIQYEQSVPGELVLRVVALRPLDDAVQREIEAAVRIKTQGGCEVHVEQVDQIPLTERGKQRLLLQHLDVSRYMGAAIDDAARYSLPGSKATATVVATEIQRQRGALMTSLAALRSTILGPAYFDHRRLIKESKSWSHEQTSLYQSRKLAPLFARYGSEVRNKEHYREHPGCYTAFALPGLTKRVTTGGTTATPFSFVRDTFSCRQKERAYIFDIWSEVGYEPFDTRVVYRGNMSDRVISRNWLENSWTVSAGRLDRESVGRVVACLREIGPFFLHVYPSSLFSLIELIGREAFKSLPVRGVLAGSEAFPAAQMRAFEAEYALPVAYWYGHSEYATLARYCRVCEGFHFYPTYGHTEFVKAPDGLNHIVATSFNRVGTRFVRYDTGDLAQISNKACHHPFARIDSIAGRVQEYFLDREGVQRAFGPFLFGIHNQFWDLISSVQFFQRRPGAIGVRLAFKPSASSAQRTWVHDFLSDRFALVDLEFIHVDTIAPTAAGKHRYYVNELAGTTRTA